jgi:hypothetical protein
MDLEQSGGIGHHHANILLGNEREKYKLLFSTNIYELTLFTTDCGDDRCGSEKKMESDAGKRSYEKVADNIQDYTLPISNGNTLVNTNFRGNEYKGEFNFQYWNQHRETTLN